MYESEANSKIEPAWNIPTDVVAAFGRLNGRITMRTVLPRSVSGLRAIPRAISIAHGTTEDVADSSMEWYELYVLPPLTAIC
jgi:hypothetical protein